MLFSLRSRDIFRPSVSRTLEYAIFTTEEKGRIPDSAVPSASGWRSWRGSPPSCALVPQYDEKVKSLVLSG
ncbi:hypothetical protein CO674_34935 [Rhizobium hidalgonense]|uniref:Uncharacterized protein n=1 Tax=Rhizobium hidalgonense TaxID=1538159 RepID=A0ABX4JH29_9HYPH|nr:hypothetical protein CO659_30980 [Rhizobium sp. S9]PDT19116.1 hypothetical protein CO674_34935 [Rhizobium hidalgonense]